MNGRIIRYSILILFIGGAFFLYDAAKKTGRNMGFAPQQPIQFSHKIHCDKSKINCSYCHSTYNVSRFTGMPSTQVCMNCHKTIQRGESSGLREINKLNAATKNNESIPWVRVNDLPDYVYFNHSQHVAVGKISCKECHGDITQMNITQQAVSLSMGWCLDCHRSQTVQDTLAYYKLHYKSNTKSTSDSLLVSETGGQECMHCHY